MRSYTCLGFILGFGIILAFTWQILAMQQSVQAATIIRYVAPDGADNNPCTSYGTRCRTVQRAINVANPNDEIRVAEGIYTDTNGTIAYITETITLSGGYYNLFNNRDSTNHPTTLNAQQKGRVVEISGYISPKIDGFTITGGNATSETISPGFGGGIFCKNANPFINNNIIISNVAAISPVSGRGGGISIEYAPAMTIISGNQILSNTTSALGGTGVGGGIFLRYSDASLLNNLIRGNTSGSYAGGIYFFHGDLSVVQNEIRANQANEYGGGIVLYYSQANIYDNLIIGNSAGGGWHAGGIFVSTESRPTINANRIYSNTAGAGSAIGLETRQYFTLTNNLIAFNQGGIKLWELTRYGLIANNTIVKNHNGWGIELAYGYITPTILNNIVVSNSWGIQAHSQASGTLDYNDVWGNISMNYNLPGALEPGPHNIQADPLFVNTETDDFHLLYGSPCINTGKPIPVTDDIDSDIRPQGCGWDIGADETPFFTGCQNIYLPLIYR